VFLLDGAVGCCFGEDLSGEGREFGGGEEPGVGGESCFHAGVAEVGFDVPVFFDGDLGEEESFVVALFDDEAVASDLDFVEEVLGVGDGDGCGGGEDGDFDDDVVEFCGVEWWEAGVVGGGACGFDEGVFEGHVWVGDADAAAEVVGWVGVEGDEDAVFFFEDGGEAWGGCGVVCDGVGDDGACVMDGGGSLCCCEHGVSLLGSGGWIKKGLG